VRFYAFALLFGATFSVASARVHAGHSVAYLHHQPSHAVSFRDMAPADEYFGRLKMSILEIRNRLDAFDRCTEASMRAAGTLHQLGDVRNAVMDWRQKYPRDPWLPRTLSRLSRDYRRAGGR
jgi:hypothetical protein